MKIKELNRHSLLTLAAGVLVSGLICGQSRAAAAPGTLQFETAVTRDDLQGVNSVQLSADGRFLYATPWPLGAVVVFKRDSASGALTHVQTLNDPSRLAGNTGMDLSPRSDHVVVACFQAQTAVLMSRDAKSGQLDILDTVRQGEGEVTGLAFAIDAIFSPDGRNVYVLDGGQGGIAIFAMREGKLEWLEANAGVDGCLGGSRGVAMDPKGEMMYVASSGANTLTVLRRDQETGRLKVQQVIHDEEQGVHGLAGAFGVVCSKDGQFVYATSGRFSGDSAVSVFRRNRAGELEVVQEFVADRGELPSFLGGNRLILSPDEKNVYAVATRSGSLACFQRDAESGRLKRMETLTRGKDQGILGGAAGIAIGPEGNHVYVAAEEQKTISIYRRAQ